MFRTEFWILFRANSLQGWRRLLAVRTQSRLLTGVIATFIVTYGVLAFFLFFKGLQFLGRFPGLGELLVERMLLLLFACLFILLLFSNLVIGYTNFFRNRETEFLLSLPVSYGTVFGWKFFEASVLASWAFLFLIAPLVLAFGLSGGAGWQFYGLAPPVICGFVVVPAALGSWAAIQIARFFDRRTFQCIAIVTIIGLAVGARFWLKSPAVTDDMLETRVLAVVDQLLGKTEFSRFAYLPSYWVASSLLRAAEGSSGASLFFATVVLSYALLLGYLAFFRTGSMFYEAFSLAGSRRRLFGRWGFGRESSGRGGHGRPVGRRGPLERAASGLPGIGPDVRAVLVKDARMFWRDTAQWGQSLVLFGLLAVYVMNLRHYTHQLSSPFWIQLVSYLNLAACSLNLATLTTRFVFPQFSLEGKRIWFVGIAPLGIHRVVRAKFWLSTTCSLVVTVSLMTVSCSMLKIPWVQTVGFVAAISLMTFALNGLATGLGVLYPNFKVDQPSKIVSSFGGTFCLVLSFVYILASVSLLALGAAWGRDGTASTGRSMAGWAGFIAVSYGIGALPYQMGLRRLGRLEI